MRPLYTAFFTRGTLYEQEAARLRKSLDALSLPHDIRPIDDQGGWTANSRYTATHILAMMDAYPDRPIVQLDADAVVWRRPDLFEDGLDCDVAGHFRRGHELLNGTLYIAPTYSARRCMERYWGGVAANPRHTHEQKLLQAAVEEMEKAGTLRFHRLPPGYAFIHDLMAGDLGPNEEVVVEHLQASREHRRCGMLPSRRRRLEEIDAAGRA